MTAKLGQILPFEEETRFPPSCRRALIGATLMLDVRRDAQTVCGLADGTRVFLRGYVRDGVIDLTYPRHLEVISDD